MSVLLRVTIIRDVKKPCACGGEARGRQSSCIGGSENNCLIYRVRGFFASSFFSHTLRVTTRHDVSHHD